MAFGSASLSVIFGTLSVSELADAAEAAGPTLM
jgi:hypothetical protein